MYSYIRMPFIKYVSLNMAIIICMYKRVSTTAYTNKWVHMDIYNMYVYSYATTTGFLI